MITTYMLTFTATEGFKEAKSWSISFLFFT